MPGSHSGLTTRGRCLLAAGLAAALCALLLDERDLLRIAAFVVVLPVLAVLVVRQSQVGLRAGRELVPARIAVGDGCEVQLTVCSRSRFGSRVLLEDDMVPEMSPQPQFMVQLPRNSTVPLYYPLRPRQRGVHPVGPLRARATDPFGLAETTRELAGPDRLVVIPVVVPLAGMPAGGGLDTGHDSTGLGPNRSRRGQDEDSVVVRGYRHGDDLRKVHWRSTARRDELMVRVEERPQRGGTVVLLDHRIAAHRGSGPDSSLEYAVSLVASMWVHLKRHGHRVRLITADSHVLADTEGADHGVDAALDALAALRASHHPELPGGHVLAEARDMVAVLGASEPAAVGQLLRLPTRGLHSHAVLLDVAAWGDPAQRPAAAAPDPAEAARVLAGVGWSVAVAEPQQPVSSVWERLCLSSRNKQGAVR